MQQFPVQIVYILWNLSGGFHTSTQITAPFITKLVNIGIEENGLNLVESTYNKAKQKPANITLNFENLKDFSCNTRNWERIFALTITMKHMRSSIQKQNDLCNPMKKWPYSSKTLKLLKQYRSNKQICKIERILWQHNTN